MELFSNRNEKKVVRPDGSNNGIPKTGNSDKIESWMSPKEVAQVISDRAMNLIKSQMSAAKTAK